jgi:biotin synthase
MSLTPESQFLCFLAGANSIFLGEKLLTSPNPQTNVDAALMDKVGLKFQAMPVHGIN